jgi:hypothetical protein
MKGKRMRTRQARKIIRAYGEWKPIEFGINGKPSVVEYFSVGKWSKSKKVRQEIQRMFFPYHKGIRYSYRMSIKATSIEG